MTPENRRGAVFGLGGALSVTAAGGSYLAAGWFSELTNPAAAVTMCAVICLGATVLLAARWPSGELDTAVSRAYATGPGRRPRTRRPTGTHHRLSLEHRQSVSADSSDPISV